MSAAPPVGVAAPCFDAERYLATALDSAPGQEDVAVDVLVADAGSTDGPTAVLARHADRVRVLRRDYRGPAAARPAVLPTGARLLRKRLGG